MGIEGISAYKVSNKTKEVNDQVKEFRKRPLNKGNLVLWDDALYERIRDNVKVINTAVLMVRDIDLNGILQIISVEQMYNESEET